MLVVGVVIGGMALAGAGGLGRSDGAATAAPSTWTGPRTTTSSPWTATPTRPSSTRSTPTTTPTPTWTSTPTFAGNDVVDVSDSAARHAYATAVVDVVTTYFVSINDRDFQTWVSLFTPAMQAEFDLDQLAVAFRSTYDSEVRLVSIEDLADGRVAAEIQFVSTQDAVDGPDGLTCTRWGIELFLQVEQGRLAIGPPPPGYQASYQAC